MSILFYYSNINNNFSLFDHLKNINILNNLLYDYLKSKYPNYNIKIVNNLEVFLKIKNNYKYIITTAYRLPTYKIVFIIKNLDDWNKIDNYINLF